MAHGQKRIYDQEGNVISVEPRAVLLCPLVLSWATKADNPPIEDNRDPIKGTPLSGGGKRIFVGAKTPAENNPRYSVMLEISMVPVLPHLKVYLKALDVDDTTDEAFDRDNKTGRPVIDTNGRSGGDNLGDHDFEGHRVAGVFVANGQPSYTATLNEHGKAEVEFRVSMQPGNNYRVAATVWSENEIAKLQSDDATALYFVSAYTDKVRGGFDGVLSPVLTVWRKLHIEVELMEEVPTSGPEKNFEQGTIVSCQPDVPAAGQSTLRLDIVLKGVENQYENGRLEIGGVGTFFVVWNRKNFEVQVTPIPGGGPVRIPTPDDVVVVGTPAADIVGKPFKIYDDDDRFLAELGLPPALPKDSQSGRIIQGIRSVFFPAFIDVVDANAEGFNPRKRIPFRLNASPIGMAYVSVFDDAQDIKDSRMFWAHTVVFGYQPGESEDGDPDIEGERSGVLLGGTPKIRFLNKSLGYSVICIEAIRDVVYGGDPGPMQPSRRNELDGWIFGIVAHEMGHSPGGQSEGTNHAEEGLMIQGGTSLEYGKFRPATIRRFRIAKRWSE